ncbi:MAG: response regulator transcription factor [Micropruina sp.]|uniref:response regulator n=1 Tax=Micropruina sp. TaxID=2737536 RepID=UPI0039E50015
MTELRILLVDDHSFCREGVKAMLAATGAAVRVVGEAASGENAVELTRGLVPDAVVMDIRLPGMSGLEAIRRILAERPTVPILMLTMADDETVLAAVRAGARGYLLTDASIDALVRALFAVYEGQAIFSPESASRVMGAAIGVQRSAPPFP